MGIDLGLTGAMTLIGYVSYVFIGQKLSPLADSRRRARRLQLWYARSIAIVLMLSSLVTLWVTTASLKEGVVLAVTTAILPMAGVSLVFSALVLKRLFARRRGTGSSGGAQRRPPVAAPMSLAELQEREERIRQGRSEEDARSEDSSERLLSEMDALDEQLDEQADEHLEARQHRETDAGDNAVTRMSSSQARQQHA